MPPGLTIIVPANNEEAYLAKCLSALMASEPPNERVQILVMANACTDATVAIAKSFESPARQKGWSLQAVDLAQPGKLNAAGVGRDQRVGCEKRINLGVEGTFGVDVLDNCLAHPCRIANPVEIFGNRAQANTVGG